MQESKWLNRTKPGFRNPIIYLALAIIIYFVLLLPTVGRYGIAWDEVTDMRIARSYVSHGWRGWFDGSAEDPSQVRLPMYFTAIIFFLFKNESLCCARVVSSILGALTILGAYVFCVRKFDHKTGLLACFILATSPYFLSFSRIAFTESDMFVTCTLVWSMICVSVLQEKQSVGWATLTAIVVGLALSSKVSAFAAFPAIYLALTIVPEDRKRLGNVQFYNKMAIAGVFIGLLCASIFGGWAIAYFSKQITYSGWFAVSHYILVLLVWITFIIYLFFHRKFVMRPFSLGLLVLAFAFLTFIVIPPAHTTRPAIIWTLLSSFLSFGKGNSAFVPEATMLHFGSVLFKSSLLIGVWLWMSLLITMFQSRYRKEVRLPLLVFVFYFLFLMKMPFAQTFYMMPLLPILAIFASDQFVRFYARRHLYAIALGCLLVCSLVVDMFLCYPDYNLNGYQWLGERYLWGRSTIGYCSIVQTTTDGIEQVFRWANDNIREGETVVIYIDDQAIIPTVCPNPVFERIQWPPLEKSKSILMNADYVISNINSEIRQGLGTDNPTGDIHVYPYDVKLVRAHFTKVYSIRRAFNLEVASVWRNTMHEKK